jgi:hypothetical protein
MLGTNKPINSSFLIINCALACLLAQSCAQTLTGPTSGQSSANPQDYIWQPNALTKGIDYYLVRQGTGSDHLLSSADDSHIRDAALNGTAFVLHSYTDSVILDSLGLNSIFSLPAGFAFAGRSQTTVRYLGVNALITMPSGRTLAGTDSGIYYSDDELTWTRTFGGSVRVLVRDNSRNVYAALGDSLITSSDEGASWSLRQRPHPTVPISALAWASSGELYAGYANTYGVERSQGGVLTSYGRLTIPVRSVTALAVRNDSLGEEIVVADSAGIWSYVSDSNMHYAVCPQVRRLYIDSTDVAYAGTDGLGLFVRQSFLGQWSQVAKTQGDTIVDVIGHALQGVFALTSSGQLLSVIGGQFSRDATTHPEAHALCIDRQSRILVGTDAGVVAVDGGVVQPGTLGPSSATTIQTPGGLTILERHGMSAPIQGITPNAPTGFSWLGGMLIGPGLDSGVTITARVMDHLDSLQKIPSAADPNKKYAYGESFIIRYAHENPDGSLFANFPLYWLVYYSRGVGPVWIEEYMLGMDKTYTINEQATLFGN